MALLAVVDGNDAAVVIFINIVLPHKTPIYALIRWTEKSSNRWRSEPWRNSRHQNPFQTSLLKRRFFSYKHYLIKFYRWIFIVHSSELDSHIHKSCCGSTVRLKINCNRIMVAVLHSVHNCEFVIFNWVQRHISTTKCAAS